MNECLPVWMGPAAFIFAIGMWALGFHQGRKYAIDEWITKTTLDWIKFKARLGERYMAEKDKARGEDA